MRFDRNLLAPNALARWAKSNPDDIALEHIDGRRLSFAKLHAQALRWAGGLARLGVEAKSHVGTLLPNDFDGRIAILAIGWLRAIEVPINAAYTGKMLQYVLDWADVTTLITSREFLPRLEAIADQLPTLQTVIVVDGDPPPISGKKMVGRDVLDRGTAPQGLTGPDVWDTALLLYTSGTTGPSKAVISPWGVVYQSWSYAPDEAVQHGQGLFSPFPVFHIAGRSVFQCTLARGARLVIRDKFSPTNLWDDVRRTNCRTLALVGPLTALLWSAPPKDDDADNPVEYVFLGPMIPEMEAFEKRFGVKCAVAYGQTENGTPITSGWDHGPPACTGKQRTIWPFPELRIVNEHDEPLGPGEVGELVVHTREPWGINNGYYKMPEKTVEAWRNGWFHTGDAMTYDEDGNYYFVDRLTDTIRRRGENISSFEVEGFVCEHPKVQECAALGIKNALGDQDVMVIVTTIDGEDLDPAELIAFLKPKMPLFMLPRYVEIVDELPKSESSARVRKSELRARGLTAQTWDREASA